MSDRYNDNNTDNQNTMNIPIPPNRPQYRKKKTRPQQQRNYVNYNNSYTNYDYYDYPEEEDYYSPPPRKKKHKKKKRHKNPVKRLIRRIFALAVIVFLFLFLMYSCTAVAVISRIDKQETGERFRSKNALSRTYVKSVLVIGTDGRSVDEQGRSDSMILLSFNSRSKKIILTSFMRDCYVDIAGYGYDKLNASYSYGGAELLMDTIENNFNIKIDDYVLVNFMSFASLIDAVGGIDIKVTADEAQEINNILFSEVNGLMGDDQWADFLEVRDGKVRLNGKQALSYARIRYVGNSDFERTSRQREVITKIIPKFVNPVSIGKVVKRVVPEVSTNMSAVGMYFMSLKLPFAIGYDIEQIQIPADDTFYPEDVWCWDGSVQSVLQVDLDANYNILKKKIFSR